MKKTNAVDKTAVDKTIAKDVASQPTRQALLTIRRDFENTKRGEGCLTEMSLTQPETKTNGMQRAN